MSFRNTLVMCSMSEAKESKELSFERDVNCSLALHVLGRPFTFSVSCNEIPAGKRVISESFNEGNEFSCTVLLCT